VALGVVTAQEEEWRVVENPYQEDLAYSVGETFSPGVELDGLRWRSFRIAAAEGEIITAGEDVSTEVFLEFENRGRKGVRVLVILLLEDEDGTPLERIEARTFKVAGNRLKERVESVTISGDVLRATRRVYAFCEIVG
jgi:hypothetical protein